MGLDRDKQPYSQISASRDSPSSVKYYGLSNPN
jgi:hypothetical protein